MDGDATVVFGRLLRQYRDAAGLTQEELAERAGLSAEAISLLERGGRRRPHPYTVQTLAEALQLPAAERAALGAAVPRRRPHAPLDAIAHPPGGPAPPALVGRAHEVALLERHLAGEGPPALLFAGEPGIGKSRLLREAMQRAPRLGWQTLQGGCQRRGGQEPYAPLLQALESYLRRQTTTQPRQDLQGCAWLVHLLPELAERRIEPLPPWHLSPEQQRRLMFAAVGRLLSNVAGTAGTLLVLDDLQWAGSDALDLLTTLLHATPEARLRVVGAYRDTEAGPATPLAVTLADLAHAGLAAQQSLQPLAPDDATALIAALLAGVLGAEIPVSDDARGWPAQLQERILRRAGGVPFFLLSYAQGSRTSAVDGGAEDVAPWDVTQSVRQRVAALPERAREALGGAAIMGRVVHAALLTAVTEQPEREALDALDAACHARLLVEIEDDAYQFAHDVIREVVEADLGAARRAMLHRRAAEALERASDDPPADAVAYHYARTREHAKAGYWLEQAGDRAAAGFANAAALEHYSAGGERLRAGKAGVAASRASLSRLDEKVGDLRTRLGEFAQAGDDFARARALETEPARRAELGRKEGVAWRSRGEYARALSIFAAVEDEGRTSDGGTVLPGAVRAALELSRGDLYRAQGAYDVAEAALERATALLGIDNLDEASSRLLARVAHAQSMLAFERRDLARAEECARRCLALAQRGDDQALVADSWGTLGRIASFRGDLAGAEEYGRRGLDAAERLGDHMGVTNALTDLGMNAWFRGDLAAAERYYERESLLSRRVGSQRSIALGWGRGGIIAGERGDLAVAARWQRTGRRLARRIGDHDAEAICSVFHAWTLLQGGPAGPLHGARLHLARALLANGRILATTHHMGRHALLATLFTAMLHLRQGALPEARAAAEEVRRMAVGGGWRRHDALARRLLGQCALARGVYDEAGDHLRAALALQIEDGAHLEAARTRLALARTYWRMDASAAPPPGAGSANDTGVLALTLLMEARTGFVASGAALDVTTADAVAKDWQHRGTQ
jgi:transcriptional regulator with XRE-family HTH domain/tetratricopeptide (TPR) repeat protein